MVAGRRRSSTSTRRTRRGRRRRNRGRRHAPPPGPVLRARSDVSPKRSCRSHIAARIAHPKATRREVDGRAIRQQLLASMGQPHMLTSRSHREEGATTHTLQPRIEHRASSEGEDRRRGRQGARRDGSSFNTQQDRLLPLPSMSRSLTKESSSNETRDPAMNGDRGKAHRRAVHGHLFTGPSDSRFHP